MNLEKQLQHQHTYQLLYIMYVYSNSEQNQVYLMFYRFHKKYAL